MWPVYTHSSFLHWPSNVVGKLIFKCGNIPPQPQQLLCVTKLSSTQKHILHNRTHWNCGWKMSTTDFLEHRCMCCVESLFSLLRAVLFGRSIRQTMQMSWKTLSSHVQQHHMKHTCQSQTIKQYTQSTYHHYVKHPQLHSIVLRHSVQSYQIVPPLAHSESTYVRMYKRHIC